MAVDTSRALDSMLPLSREVLETVRKAREDLARVEKLLGFGFVSGWSPISISSGGPIAAGDDQHVFGRCDQHFRGKALVVLGDAAAFEFLNIQIGGHPHLDSHAFPLPCEQYAYDNPPRLLNFDSMQPGLHCVFHVFNRSGNPAVFRATMWGELRYP